jgi:hypothetical protein
VSGLRVVFAALGLSILLNLVTAHRLLSSAALLKVLGEAERNSRVQVAIASFDWQFSFSLIFFGVYLILQGWLIYRSRSIPKWLGIALALDGAIWILIGSGPYLLPGVSFGPLFAVTFIELLLPVWLVGFGLRLREP